MNDRHIYLDETGSRYTRRKITLTPWRHAVTITLNRDGYCDTHGTDKLPAEYTDALDRCRTACGDRIWADGYTGNFSWGNGPRFITLFAPYEHGDAVVDALRVAELDQDYTGLHAIAEAVAPPISQWLAPGERTLRRGIDFRCTPNQFVTVIRGFAKGRGLRANARAIGDEVWVRPILNETERHRRRLFPERYTDNPDVYTGTSSPWDSDRPMVPWREREDSNLVNPVRFVTSQQATPNPDCPCGYRAPWSDYSTEGHDRHHMRWSTGVPVSANLGWRFRDIAIVTTSSSKVWRQVAHSCAQVARVHGGYDFSSFTVGVGPTESPINERAYLYRAHGKIVGYLKASEENRNGHWDYVGDERIPLSDGTTRPSVNLIFVADVWRRHGIATSLVRALAGDSGVEVDEVSWSMPISDRGKALIRSLSPDGAWVCR